MTQRTPLSLDEALARGASDSAASFARHHNPGLASAYRWLGTAELDVVDARGALLRLRDGREIVDVSQGFGVSLFGHACPLVRAAQERFRASGLPDVLKVAPHPLVGALCEALARVAPAPLEIAFPCTSGAEAIEAALKLAERATRRTQGAIVTTKGSYHGKTHGALAITASGRFREGFVLGFPSERVVEVEFGDLAGIERALASAPGGAIAAIVEPVQGQGIVEPPRGYLAGVVAACSRHGALSIFDEVKCGLGRTGELFAFERDACVPDVVTLGKGLGGGVHALAAMLTSTELFERAYGARGDAALHTTSFGGLGEACAVGIESVALAADPATLERTRALSQRFDGRLRALAARHPTVVRGVRGRGLFRGLEITLDRGVLARLLSDDSDLAHNGEVLFAIAVVRALFQRHDVLAHFCESDPRILHLMPPLSIEERELDRVADALDAFFDTSLVRTLASLGLRAAR